MGFLLVFHYKYVNNFFCSHFFENSSRKFFNNRLKMLNLKFYVSTCKIVGGDSKTSWQNTPKKRYGVIYIQSFCLVFEFELSTFKFHKNQELIFVQHFPHQELPLPFKDYSASTEPILFGFFVFFQLEESQFDAKVALKKILMREGCRCCCTGMNEWGKWRKIIEEYFLYF